MDYRGENDMKTHRRTLPLPLRIWCGISLDMECIHENKNLIRQFIKTLKGNR